MHYKQTGRKSRESEHRVRNLQGREKKLVSEMVSGWEKKKDVNIKSGQLAFLHFFSSLFFFLSLFFLIWFWGFFALFSFSYRSRSRKWDGQHLTVQQ